MLHLRKVVALRETANEALLRSGRFMVIFRPFSKVRSLKCFFLYYYFFLMVAVLSAAASCDERKR